MHPEICLGCSSKQIEQTFGKQWYVAKYCAESLKYEHDISLHVNCYTNYSGEYELMIVISRSSDEIDMKVGQLSKLENKYAMT